MIDYSTGDIFVMRPPRQTLAAWQPFWDCVSILFQFQNSDIHDGDEELTEWRIFWVAGITLLRTIGHVLAKVDASASVFHGSSIQNLWNQWQTDREGAAIFWEFVEDERNNLLKTYSFGAHFARTPEGAFIMFKDGSDAFDLYRQAVYWWRYQLMELEMCLAATEDGRD